MEKNTHIGKEFALETIIQNAVQIPGIKVSRTKFLSEIFGDSSHSMEEILREGPVNAGVMREELQRIAMKLIVKRTSQSSAASFVAGIPGGWAMAATIPADIMQFFGMSLRLAQEISYLYGAEDLWRDGAVDEERVRNQLILYCGVMFGVSSAISGLRVVTLQMTKTVAKKLPEKALTKTFWYPIVKRIGAALSVKVTKTTFANGLSKVVPIIGGVISGTLNFVSMMPMATRLQSTFDKACFDYGEEDLEQDIVTIMEEENAEKKEKRLDFKNRITTGFKNAKENVTDWFGKVKTEIDAKRKPKEVVSQDDVFNTLEKLKGLADDGILTQDEYEAKKAELLARI